MRPSTRPSTRAARVAATALTAALALGLSACSGGSSDSGAASVAGGSAQDLGSAEPASPPGDEATAPALTGGRGTTGSPTTRGDASTTVRAAVADRRLARRADVSLRVDDVAAAAARLRAVAAGAGGLVVAEEVTSDVLEPESDVETDVDTGDEPSTSIAPRGYGTVTISVPTDRLDSTLDALARIGQILSRNTSTDDVTGQYVDVTARVATMTASVERVRSLMSRATRLADVVSLESELSRRQADLEAMQQQLAALEDQVALAPITVTLTTDAAPVVVDEEPPGFLSGLGAGWDAFTTTVRVALTALGAVLPFVLAAALVAVPLVVWRRRRHGAAVAATPPAPAA